MVLPCNVGCTDDSNCNTFLLLFFLLFPMIKQTRERLRRLFLQPFTLQRAFYPVPDGSCNGTPFEWAIWKVNICWQHNLRLTYVREMVMACLLSSNGGFPECARSVLVTSRKALDLRRQAKASLQWLGQVHETPFLLSQERYAEGSRFLGKFPTYNLSSSHVQKKKRKIKNPHTQHPQPLAWGILRQTWNNKA